MTAPLPTGPVPFEAFVLEHGAELVAFARRLTLDHHRAEDIVQDVLARLGLSWARVQWQGPNAAASKPSSISLVRSGPRSGLPTLSGKNAGCPPHPVPVAFSHVRTASNAPGARPDWPHAARNFISGICFGQNVSSDATHDALNFGYA